MSNISEATSLPTEAWTSRFWALVQTRKFGVFVALASLVTIAFYVFVVTPYPEFLFSDMRKFWTSALTRLEVDIGQYEEAQFVAWPPLYHIFLAELFRVLQWLGLSSLIRLETVLFMNMAVYSVSVYAFHRLAVSWFDRPQFVLIAVLLYAFGFPALYFNAFLLSENLGAPLMVIAVAIFALGSGWRALAAAAALFALATIVRPSLGPFGLAFVLYYLVQYGLNWKFIGRAAAFSAIFFGMVLLASAEVSRISQGKVFGLSANGGLDFFIAVAQPHRVDVNYDGWHFFVIAPAFSWKPENGRFHFNVPFYEQGFFFAEGLEYIKREPARLLQNFGHVRNLFFADMLPSMEVAPGFTFFRPVWDWFKFGMFLALGLYFWCWRALGARTPLFTLLISTIALTLVVSFIFTGEPRYTYSLIFVFYLLFFKLVEYFYLDWQRWKKALTPYSVVLAAGMGIAVAAPALLEPDYPPTVHMSVTPQQASPAGQASAEYTVGNVMFPFDRKGMLKHASLKHAPIEQPAQIKLQTNFTVTGPQPLSLWFDICSSWPYRILIDGKPWSPNGPLDYFLENNVSAQLDPGAHTMEVIVDYWPNPTPDGGGFAISYNYIDRQQWRERRTLGVNSDRVRFSLPKTTSP